MERVAFVIQVRPDRLAEYRRLHTPIWPELAAELKRAGMRNYSLWLRPDGTEFGYLECDSWQAACDYLATSEVHTRWQAMMQGFLLTPTDAGQGGQPVQMLDQVFFLP